VVPSRAGTKVLLLVLVSLAASCTSAATDDAPVGGSPPEITGPTSESSSSPSQPQDRPGLADARIDLQQVAVLEQPVALAVRPDDQALYFAEKVGRVVVLREDGAEPDVILDINGEVSQGSEQGLLGLAFSPDGDFLYINYTDVQGHTHVTKFRTQSDGLDLGSRRDVLFVPQPFSNHNGGNLAFGPDGYLYVGLGDGGSGGDPDGNGQSLQTLLGKMLRISPRPSDGDPYGIPPDNPFVGQDGARAEIWAYGLRNPWRYSFDRENGDLWIGDVGQSEREEIDVELAGSAGGLNFGWNLFEGTLSYEGGSEDDQTVSPVYEYPNRSGGCSVTGGYVYRGSRSRISRAPTSSGTSAKAAWRRSCCWTGRRRSCDRSPR